MRGCSWENSFHLHNVITQLFTRSRATQAFASPSVDNHHENLKQSVLSVSATASGAYTGFRFGGDQRHREPPPPGGGGEENNFFILFIYLTNTAL